MTCKLCEINQRDISYVGETGRKVKERVQEHLTKYSNRLRLSEVGKHSIECHDRIDRNDWTIEILKNVKDDFTRKAYEATIIARQQPKLNISKGVYVLGLEMLKL